MTQHLERLIVAASKPERLVVGMISGTSVDAIDVAVCRIGPGGSPTQLIHFGDRPYPDDLRASLTRLEILDVRDVAELHVRVGESFATAAREVLAEVGIEPSEVDLVGSHGQTIYHHSRVPGALVATLQVGDGDIIAERLGIPVISDFRARDVAAGGEGAPLTPRADVLLFGHATENGRRAILNLGGIANITVLDADPANVLGFDTGPANALIDRAAQRISGGKLKCDVDGAIARSGEVHRRLLDQLITSDTFLRQPPPKSTGFEMYGDAFLDQVIQRFGRVDADLLATLTEFSALSVALALQQFVRTTPAVDEVVVAGGGASNPFLMERLAARLAPCRVRRSEELGVPSGAREAMGFAILADLALRGETSNLPSVTGAKRAAVLGKLSFGH